MSNFEPFTLKPQTTDNYINLYMYLYVSFNCILLYVLYTQIFVLSVFDVLCHLNLIVSAAVGLTELSLNKGSLKNKRAAVFSILQSLQLSQCLLTVTLLRQHSAVYSDT